MTTKQQTETRKKMKSTGAALRKQGLTQEQTAAELGVSRDCVRRWEKPVGKKGQSAISPHGRPSKLTDSQKEHVRTRLASGASQRTVADELGVDHKTIGSAIRSNGKPTKNKAAKSISERATAGRRFGAEGGTLK